MNVSKKYTAKLLVNLYKCLKAIGYKNTNAALVQATKNPFYIHGDLVNKIINVVCAEFKISSEYLFTNEKASKSQNKNTVIASKFCIALIFKYCNYKLYKLGNMFSPSKPIPTIWRYTNIAKNYQEKIDELKYILLKISDVKAKEIYSKKIQEFEQLLKRYDKLDKKLNNLYNG